MGKVKKREIIDAVERGLSDCDLARLFGRHCYDDKIVTTCAECRRKSYEVILGCKGPKEFDWDGFGRGEFAVNCRTEEDAKEFCKAMHEHGMWWNDGTSYLHSTEFSTHRDKTAYFGNGLYGNVQGIGATEKRIVEYKPGKYRF